MELHYYPKEQRLCWIAGYTPIDNTRSVAEIISGHSWAISQFCQAAKTVKPEDVQTFFVERSRRYKYMRVFYASLPPEDVPQEAIVFDNDREMYTWLQD